MTTDELLDEQAGLGVMYVAVALLDNQGIVRHTLRDMRRGSTTRQVVELICSLRDYDVPAPMALGLVELARPALETTCGIYLREGSSGRLHSETVAKAATTGASILLSGGTETDPRQVDRAELDETIQRLADGA